MMTFNTDQGQLNLSQKIISVAATRLNNMSQNKSSHYRAKVEAYTTEYYMLRIYLVMSLSQMIFT
jgi:hypothetical protein